MAAAKKKPAKRKAFKYDAKTGRKVRVKKGTAKQRAAAKTRKKRVHSAATRKKMSLAAKRRWKTGKTKSGRKAKNRRAKK